MLERRSVVFRGGGGGGGGGSLTNLASSSTDDKSLCSSTAFQHGKTQFHLLNKLARVRERERERLWERAGVYFCCGDRTRFDRY